MPWPICWTPWSWAPPRTSCPFTSEMTAPMRTHLKSSGGGKTVSASLCLQRCVSGDHSLMHFCRHGSNLGRQKKAAETGTMGQTVWYASQSSCADQKPEEVGAVLQVKPTAAKYTLRDPVEVMSFLISLVDWGRTQDNAWHAVKSCYGWRLNAEVLPPPVRGSSGDCSSTLSENSEPFSSTGQQACRGFRFLWFLGFRPRRVAR